MKHTTPDKLRRELQASVIAYNQVFQKDGVHTLAVLQDLAKFCRADESCFHQDPRLHAALEGRREVWLRIQAFLQLNVEELYRLHPVKIIKGE